MRSSITLNCVVTTSPLQLSCNLSGEIVILNLGNGEYFGLRGVGARVWETIQQRSTVKEVRDLLLVEYPDVDSERCTADLLRLLSELSDAELVQVVESAE